MVQGSLIEVIVGDFRLFKRDADKSRCHAPQMRSQALHVTGQARILSIGNQQILVDSDNLRIFVSPMNSDADCTGGVFLSNHCNEAKRLFRCQALIRKKGRKACG